MENGIRTAKRPGWTPAVSGAIAGGIATGPMTLAMLAMQRNLPASERSPLPPATIVHDLILARRPAPSWLQSSLAIGAHFAYGSAAGTLYATTFGRVPLPAIARGGLFGAAFWAANYWGIAPLLGLRASAPKMPARRNAMMFLAHLVWGGALAYGEETLRLEGRDFWTGSRKASAAE